MESGDVKYQKIILSNDRIIGHSNKKHVHSLEKLNCKSFSRAKDGKKMRREYDIPYGVEQPVVTTDFDKTNMQSTDDSNKDACNIFFNIPLGSVPVIPDRRRGPCNCIIEILLKRPFRSLPFARKLEIIRKGPPKPSINSLILYNSKMDLQKSFTRNCLIYENTPWMCGCIKYKKLYCWPCLLFSKFDNVWRTSGYSDYNSLDNAEKIHRMDNNHILSMRELNLFGVADRKLSSCHKILVNDYNDIVKHNRNILKYVITAICYLASGGINLYDSNEISIENSKINDGNYFNLMNIIAEYNNDLRTHINTRNMFLIFSSNLCNELVFCISEIILQEIKKEISETSFVSLILNEIAAVRLTNYMSFVIRYVDKKGCIKQRFLNFIELPSNDRGSYSFVKKCIIKIINELDCGKKLVAFNVDGGLFEIDKLSCLQLELRKKFTQVLFVDSYFGDLSASLSQSLCFIDDVKLFFASLSSFRDFFSSFGKKMESRDDFLKVSEDQWSSETGLITILYKSKKKLEDFFSSIIYHPKTWNLNTILMAYNLYMLLNDFHFNFYLALFYLILPVAKSLFHAIQKHILIDNHYCCAKIDGFNSYLLKLLENFDGFWTEICASNYSKRKSDDCIPDDVVNEPIPKYDKAIFYEYFKSIIGTVISNIVTRYNNLRKINFFSLLDVKRFKQFKTEFPVLYLNSLSNTYSSHFDLNRLKNELNVLYWDRMNINFDLFNLYNYFRRSNLDGVFPETCKLCELILTMPMLHPGDENITAFTRMKRYVKMETHTNLFPSLAILFIERLYLEQIKTKKDFEDSVINMFAMKNHKIKLIYKT